MRNCLLLVLLTLVFFNGCSSSSISEADNSEGFLQAFHSGLSTTLHICGYILGVLVALVFIVYIALMIIRVLMS